MADPVVVECSSACTVTLEISAPLLNLTTAEAAELAVPMIAVLALGWGFRMLIKTMNHASGGSGSSDPE